MTYFTASARIVVDFQLPGGAISKRHAFDRALDDADDAGDNLFRGLLRRLDAVLIASA